MSFVNEAGLRTAFWQSDLGAELPLLAESGHRPTNATLSPVSRGIDCPEKGRAYGKKAKHAASDVVFGKDVTVQTHGHDKYKRILGDVILSDGMNLNQELVNQGWCWCWWYRKYAPGLYGAGRVREPSARAAEKT